jgi:hypothetical protein
MVTIGFVLALVVLAGELLVVARLLQQPEAPPADVSAGRSGGPATPAAGSSVAEATPTPSSAPTVLPAERLAEPAATSAPGPATVAAETRPTGVPTLSTAAPAYAQAAGPAEAVVSFYRLIDAGQLGQAAQLWTSRMQANYPPAENVWQRFARVDRIIVQRAEVVALDEMAGRATVAVELLEMDVSPPTTHRWAGSWEVARVGNRWLLDQPNLHGA